MMVQALLTEATWIKDNYALDVHGNYVDVHDPKACKFCLIGAIQRCYIRGAFDQGPGPELTYNEAISRVAELLTLASSDFVLTENALELYNDARTWPEIESLVRRAGI